MRYIDFTGGGTKGGQPWNVFTCAAGTCSITLTASETSYLIEGMTVYGGTLSNAAFHIEVSGGACLLSGYVGSAGPRPYHIPLNVEVVNRATLSAGVIGAGTAYLSMHGFKIIL